MMFLFVNVPDEDEDDEGEEEEVKDKTLPKWRIWLDVEATREANHWLPWRPDQSKGQSEEDCEDPERQVLVVHTNLFYFSFSHAVSHTFSHMHAHTQILNLLSVCVLCAHSTVLAHMYSTCLSILSPCVFLTSECCHLTPLCRCSLMTSAHP